MTRRSRFCKARSRGGVRMAQGRRMQAHIHHVRHRRRSGLRGRTGIRGRDGANSGSARRHDAVTARTARREIGRKRVRVAGSRGGAGRIAGDAAGFRGDSGPHCRRRKRHAKMRKRVGAERFHADIGLTGLRRDSRHVIDRGTRFHGRGNGGLVIVNFRKAAGVVDVHSQNQRLNGFQRSAVHDVHADNVRSVIALSRVPVVGIRRVIHCGEKFVVNGEGDVGVMNGLVNGDLNGEHALNLRVLFHAGKMGQHIIRLRRDFPRSGRSGAVPVRVKRLDENLMRAVCGAVQRKTDDPVIVAGVDGPACLSERRRDTVRWREWRRL